MSASAKKVPENPKSAPKLSGLGAWASKGKAKAPPKKRTGVSKASFDRAMTDVSDLMASGDWSKAKPIHVFALYCHLHEHVYGVPPGETGSADRTRACFQVANLIRSQFDGKISEMVDFVRWAWQREESRESWRRENGRLSGFRLGSRLLFSGTMVSDYRVQMKRAAHAATQK